MHPSELIEAHARTWWKGRLFFVFSTPVTGCLWKRVGRHPSWCFSLIHNRLHITCIPSSNIQQGPTMSCYFLQWSILYHFLNLLHYFFSSHISHDWAPNRLLPLLSCGIEHYLMRWITWSNTVIFPHHVPFVSCSAVAEKHLAKVYCMPEYTCCPARAFSQQCFVISKKAADETCDASASSAMYRWYGISVSLLWIDCNC